MPSYELPDVFQWSSIAPALGDQHFDFALEAYEAGLAFQEIVPLLAGRGLSAELIPDVTTALAKDRAHFMFATSKSLADIVRVLTERGLNPEDAAYITGLVDRERRKMFALVGKGRWMKWSLVAAGLLVATGLVLDIAGEMVGLVVPGELQAGLILWGFFLLLFTLASQGGKSGDFSVNTDIGFSVDTDIGL